MRSEDVSPLLVIQTRSYEQASPGLLESYPKDRVMGAEQLASFLERKRYAVLATARSDGRPHALPIAFSVWDGAFWMASIRGIRIRNLRHLPYAAIVIMEGEGREHRTVAAEGLVILHPVSNLAGLAEGLRNVIRERHGDVKRWATALIELRPTRLFSYEAPERRDAVLG